MVRINQPFTLVRSEPSGIREPRLVRGSRDQSNRKNTLGQQIRVLVIDDDPDILESLSESLKPPHFCVQTTDSGETFPTLFEGFEPDVVIADLRMPAHDGIDVLRILRDKDFRGDVALMSGGEGQIMETARKIAVSYGLSMAGLLRKPFSKDELIALVTGNRPDSGPGNERVATALSQRRIRPYFQPSVDLKTGAIVGAEALSRWHHPERGLLTPDTYLQNKPLAAGQSLHDFTILERALEFCARLNGIGRRIKIGVNFDVDVILADEFLKVVSDAQLRHGLPPEQLVVELPEQDMGKSNARLAECVLKIRLYGAHVALDDFGAGFSALSSIQKLPVSEIKIDRSFMAGFDESSPNVPIVRSIIEIAHSAGISVVAKGVETVETLEVLQKLGCDKAQGYLFSPAVSDSTLIALLHDEKFSFLSEE
jgi:EAL domain-containing protein (putative c-di-GMP-specific phosphodiesterase class I)